MRAVVGTLEGGEAIDAGTHCAVAPAVVLINLRSLSDMAAGSAVYCRAELVFMGRNWRIIGTREMARTGQHFVYVRCGLTGWGCRDARCGFGVDGRCCCCCCCGIEEDGPEKHLGRQDFTPNLVKST
jgi:hypothetical protein